MLGSILSSIKSLFYSEQIRDVRKYIPHFTQGQLRATFFSRVTNATMSIAQENCPVNVSFPCIDPNVIQHVTYSNAPTCVDLSVICGIEVTEYFDHANILSKLQSAMSEVTSTEVTAMVVTTAAMVVGGYYLLHRNKAENDSGQENQSPELSARTLSPILR